VDELNNRGLTVLILESLSAVVIHTLKTVAKSQSGILVGLNLVKCFGRKQIHTSQRILSWHKSRHIN